VTKNKRSTVSIIFDKNINFAKQYIIGRLKSMSQFLIEVPHEEEVVSCAKAVRILMSTGSHFLTNALFGCSDGVHKAWVIVEVDSKEEAISILPPEYRAAATIVQLNKFTLEEIENIIKYHSDPLVQSKSE
jgi:hypothetical protein